MPFGEWDKDAGHFVFGPPIARDHRFYPRLGEYGSSMEGNAAAHAESWPKVVAFLRRAFAQSREFTQND